MPATSIFIKAASSGTSGIGYSRISVLLGPTLFAASEPATTEKPPLIDVAGNLGPTLDRSSVIFRAACARLRRVLLIRPEREGRRGQDRWRCPERPRYRLRYRLRYRPRCC